VSGRSAQRDFFDQKEDDLEKWGALISRLACKLGKENVFLARPVDRYLPEKSWIKAPDSEPDSPPDSLANVQSNQPNVHATQQRPARILKNPEFLRLSGRDVIQSNGQRWRTTHWDGPERLSGEWWKDRKGFERDYYQVTTEKGEELWIFVDRQEHSPSFYLHGYFD
jgi:protein ImuB